MVFLHTDSRLGKCPDITHSCCNSCTCVNYVRPIKVHRSLLDTSRMIIATILLCAFLQSSHIRAYESQPFKRSFTYCQFSWQHPAGVVSNGCNKSADSPSPLKIWSKWRSPQDQHKLPEFLESSLEAQATTPFYSYALTAVDNSLQIAQNLGKQLSITASFVMHNLRVSSNKNSRKGLHIRKLLFDGSIFIFKGVPLDLNALFAPDGFPWVQTLWYSG